MRVLVSICLLFAAMTTPAGAATTVYAASVYSQTNTTNANNALAAADGSTATVSRPGTLVLQMSLAASGLNTVIAGVRSNAGANVQIAIGEVIGGVATFSAGVNLAPGFGTLHLLDLSALCATVSATGCSLLRIRVTGPAGSAFLLDGVSGVAAAPEPAGWALMILGFGAIAWRLKENRSRNAHATVRIA